MDLASDELVLKFLGHAFGDEPVVFDSLNFERSTEQGAHIDAIFFYPQPVYSMAGCWVALEDVHSDAGPLFYVPGGHQWPFSNGEDVVAGRRELAAEREAIRNHSDHPEQADVVKVVKRYLVHGLLSDAER